MTDHELGQMQDYEDECAEEEHCSDHVPMICAFLNCDCDDCSKGKKEIAKRVIEEYIVWDSHYGKSRDAGITVSEMGYLVHWLEEQEAEERDQRISDYTGG